MQKRNKNLLWLPRRQRKALQRQGLPVQQARNHIAWLQYLRGQPETLEAIQKHLQQQWPQGIGVDIIWGNEPQQEEWKGLPDDAPQGAAPGGYWHL